MDGKTLTHIVKAQTPNSSPNPKPIFLAIKIYFNAKGSEKMF